MVYSSTLSNTFIKTTWGYLTEDTTSCLGCSGTAALCCSSGTAATPSDNSNTTASGNNTHLTLLLSDRPFPPRTIGGILALTTTTKNKQIPLLLAVIFTPPKKSLNVSANGAVQLHISILSGSRDARLIHVTNTPTGPSGLDSKRKSESL